MIKVGKDEIELDESILDVKNETINEFLSKYASWYRYYQTKHNDANFIAKSYSDKYSSLVHSKFKYYKETLNCSDKLAEACAKSDEEVLAYQEKVRMAEYVKDELWGFLRSMDYAHENALQICYNIRKEMDKIGGSRVGYDSRKLEDIYGRS